MPHSVWLWAIYLGKWLVGFGFQLKYTTSKAGKSCRKLPEAVESCFIMRTIFSALVRIPTKIDHHRKSFGSISLAVIILVSIDC